MAQSQPRTRSTTMYDLVGHPLPAIAGAKLPTTDQVLRRFIHATLQKKGRDHAFDVTIEEVEQLWKMARIKTLQHRAHRAKLTKLRETWRGLQKSKSNAGSDKREAFTKTLGQLWDIAAPDWREEIVTNRLLSFADKQEDIAFYQDQCEARVGTIRGLDKLYAEKKKRKDQREDGELRDEVRRVEEGNMKRQVQSSILEDRSTAVQPQEEMEVNDIKTEEEEDEMWTQDTKQRKIKENVSLALPRNIMQQPKILEVADRYRISDNKLVALVSAVLRSADPPANLADFDISRQSARRGRATHRAEAAASAKEHFVPPRNAVVHWDGKTLQNDGATEHRQAILLSGPGCEGKLLAVPVLKDGKGQTQARATAEALADWDCEGAVVGVCFDTTSSNTGRMKGAIVNLEALLDRPLLHLACRHHVMELVVGAVAKKLFGATTGPTDPLFEDLKKRWSQLDHSRYHTLDCLEKLPDWTQQLREQALRALRAATVFTRDDYRELAELSLLVLQEQPARGARLLRPGACHHARWMSKTLYYTKLFMFADQLGLEEELRALLLRMVLFLALVYAPAWLACHVAADAPVLDLALQQDLLRFRAVDSDVAEAALRVLARHVWYVRPQTVPLALCSGRVTEEEKEVMARTLLSCAKPEDFADDTVVISESTELSDLIDERSWFLFDEVCVCEPSWLHLPAAEWGDHSEFKKFSEFVAGLKVTNDMAERGVKLIADFINTSTKDEGQLQALMQEVEAHRRRFPDCKKSTLETM